MRSYRVRLGRLFHLAVRAALSGCSLALVGACADGDELPDSAGRRSDAPDPPAVTVCLQVADAQGDPLDAYSVHVSRQGEMVGQAQCPDWASASLRCTAQGLLISSAARSFDVAVKAHGYQFVVESIAPDDLPVAEDETRIREISLERLDAFVQNDDYATGFDSEAGLSAFEQLSISVDTELGPSQVVKWYIHSPDDDPEVYFQNTRVHRLHYQFVRNVLGLPGTLSEFEDDTYQGDPRGGFAGSITYYPDVRVASDASEDPLEAPLVVTFFPSDDLQPAQALLAHRLLEQRLGFADLAGGHRRVTYLPAGEQQERELLDATEQFVRSGAAYLTQQQLHGNPSMQLLNPGLAYGTLRLLTPEQLESTVVSFQDVLVLTRLPNSLPVVGGTITEELQTPLAHVNVAARTRGTPNLALPGASSDPRVVGLLGQLVRFEVDGGGFSLDAATPEEARQFWDSRQPEPIILALNDERDGLPGFDEVGFADSDWLGVKAANLAELSQLLAERAPDGFAIPFYYYDQFMTEGQVTLASCARGFDVCAQSGRSTVVCDAAAELCGSMPDGESESFWDHVARLLEAPDFNTDTEVRDAALFLLRYHMTHIDVDPDFGAALNARVEQVFGSARVRIRSSTNTEDLPNFSGAGLYESVSAYGSGSRLASDEIREVWASVWGLQAFEERSFWSIDHQSVRMGCAVNQAFTQEAANGVLITQNVADRTVAGMYVNVQAGEVSVTNPEDGELPEVFSIIPAPSGIQVSRQSYSSLSPEAAILSHEEVVALYLAADAVQQHFAPLYGESPNVLALELEFKFNEPDRSLVIKQVRPYTQR